jgi:uncharacterized membrane protein required for colicin V production
MIISMALVFILAQVVFVILRRVLEAVLDFTRLGWLDRIMGAAMGVVTGFGISAAFVQIILVAAPEWQAVRSSVLAIPLESATYKLLAYVPSETRSQMDNMMSKWRTQQDFNQQPASRFGAQADRPTGHSVP